MWDFRRFVLRDLRYNSSLSCDGLLFLRGTQFFLSCVSSSLIYFTTLPTSSIISTIWRTSASPLTGSTSRRQIFFSHTPVDIWQLLVVELQSPTLVVASIFEQMPLGSVGIVRPHARFALLRSSIDALLCWQSSWLCFVSDLPAAPEHICRLRHVRR